MKTNLSLRVLSIVVMSFSLLIAESCVSGPVTGDRPGSILPAEGFAGKRNTVLFLGDSITAGYGVNRKYSFPGFIGSYWEEHGVSLKAMNVGLSGYTTGQILLYLDSFLSKDVCFVFLQIGGNDGFRSVPLDEIGANLGKIIDTIQAKGITMAMAEMLLEPNQLPAGPGYAEGFNALWDEMAAEKNIPLLPFLFKSIPDVSDGYYWQSHNLHPTKEGNRLLARDVLAFLNEKWILDIE